MLSSYDDKFISMLYSKHYDEVVAFIKTKVRNQSDVEDIASDVYYKVCQYISTYDSGRDPKAWLFTVARNAIKDYHKANSRSRLSYVDDTMLEARHVDSPENLLSAEQTEQRFNSALDKLDDIFKVPFLMREEDERSYKDIADELGIKENTVKSRISRARERIHSDMK